MMSFRGLFGRILQDFWYQVGGLIWECRQQDVRATEKDKVKIFSSFRPGDIVRAQVVSVSLLFNVYIFSSLRMSADYHIVSDLSR